jgi:hypothetical protein
VTGAPRLAGTHSTFRHLVQSTAHASSRKPLGHHKSQIYGLASARYAGTVWPVTMAVRIRGRFARLLLLACTVLGVAALHTIGHAGVRVLDHHDRLIAVQPGAVIALAPPAPADHGGCDGDGCDHPAAAPGGAGDTPRWWEICLAILGLLTAGTVVTIAALRSRGMSMAAADAVHRPPPRNTGATRLGLAMASATVLRT